MGIASVAGALGGALGVGGGVLMFPALVVGLQVEPHQARAATLLINAVVSAGATIQHRRSGNLDPRLVAGLLVASIAAAVLGILGGNRLEPTVLRKLFGGFLVLVAGLQIVRARGARPGPRGKTTGMRVAILGGTMGLSAGLLGVGGGVVAVPGQEQFLGVPLRRAIANSSASIAGSCLVAGGVALIANGGRFAPGDAVGMAAVMTLPALAGGYLGARLARTADAGWLRLAFAVFLVVVASRLALS